MAVGRDQVPVLPNTCCANRSSSRNGSVRINIEIDLLCCPGFRQRADPL
jgi:hypothetical protein